jgi:predicted RNase H-like nuclease
VTSGDRSRAAVLGVDLAWGEGNSRSPARESGVVAVDATGRVLDAGWTVGVQATAAWMERWASDDAIGMVDAPLLVRNPSGQRVCEREVGQRYGRWKVSANSTNLAMQALAGVSLLARLEAAGWRYADGRGGPTHRGRWLYEVYPYTVLVGAEELGYDRERPVYKRRPRHLDPATFRALRATTCDELVRRLVALRRADPPLDLTSHPVTTALTTEPSPLRDVAAKHREDLIDAVLCAWVGLLWLRHGLRRCQVLGTDDRPGPDGAVATIIAPARPAQRR